MKDFRDIRNNLEKLELEKQTSRSRKETTLFVRSGQNLAKAEPEETNVAIEDRSVKGRKKAPPYRSVMVVGSLFVVFFGLSQVFAGSPTQEARSPKAKTDIIIEADVFDTRFIVDGERTRANPAVPYLERVFCRGRKTSPGCSGKTYHPYLRQWGESVNDDRYTKTQLSKFKWVIQNVFKK